MSYTLTAISAALPMAAGWSLHTLRLRRRIDAARRDPLTGLVTRDAFAERAARVIANGQSAVYLIDLDRFKQINDTHGHAAGDAVLRATAKRLTLWAPTGDGIVARFGGDEFAAVTRVRSQTELIWQADELAGVLTAPVSFEGRQFVVGASVGAVPCDSNGPDLSTLLRRADEAMYAAKQNGGGRFLADGPTPVHHTVNGRRAGRRGTAGGSEVAA
ncbi:GGDEF domain-containing protein [Streptomyces sp. M2CJ-2]|uniref:GGDEF domain-containing protein n=1 Tax=Streptomyces sp. M2CJ-2 TaxID=2803948 RepID=UPI0019244E86|nr:GGDEF domain-containing protein [Streptomyces sp. M2CJ-2]MBL3666606.1 GGDEF domain-containing protein [Streptomyces sp. M2CJ-2]